jgi:branched-chain amino acid transport system ATP-binding protein
MNALLECVGLSKHFGGITAVDNIDYTIREKELRCVIGPNGAGKTTFLNLIAGLMVPESGKIVFKSKDITKLEAYRRAKLGIARTFQLTTVFQKLTVNENLEIANADKEKVVKSISNMDLSDKLEQKASHLSYGDKKRLEIAMAVSLNPSLLLLDEPFSGLCEEEIRELTALIRDLSQNLTILMIEHKILKVCDLVHKITVLDQGKIICDGCPEEVLNDPVVKKVYWRYE